MRLRGSYQRRSLTQLGRARDERSLQKAFSGGAGKRSPRSRRPADR